MDAERGKSHDTDGSDQPGSLCSGVGHLYRGRGFRPEYGESQEDRRFQAGDYPEAALNLVANTKVLGGLSSKLVHDLWLLINALAIELPSVGTQVVEDLLKANILLVEEVYDDTVAIVDGGSRCVKIVPELGEDVLVPQKYTWNMMTIGVPAVHPQRQGSGVRVAVLDTGIASHLELSGPIERYNARYGESSNANDDDNGHGTHMAGIIAAELNNPAAGVIGVAPQATLLAVKVLDRYGAGYLSDFINGLQWVYNNGKPAGQGGQYEHWLVDRQSPPEESHPRARQATRDHGGLRRQQLPELPGPGRGQWRRM